MTKALLAAMAVLALVLPTQAAVMLDLSDGFTYDAFVGPGEDAYADSQGDDVKVIYGGSEQFNLMGQGYGFVVTGTDYSGVATAGNGIPADGVFTAASGTVYHTASLTGNATYPGNLLEVADPSTLAFMPNSMTVRSDHNKNSFQIALAEAVLPAAQQQSYVDINFLLAASSAGNAALNMELYVDYTDGSSVLVWSGDATSPQPADNAGDANWQIAQSFEWLYNASSGANGAVESNRGTHSLYEFSTPIALDSNKVLKGVRLLDNNPSANWKARGAFDLAATATEVPEPASLGLLAIGGLVLVRRRRAM